MTTPYKTDKAESLEGHIEDLQRQKGMLQDIEKYTDKKVDFGDIIETHQLIDEEITKLQECLRQYKTGEKREGTGARSPPPTIEHVVRDGKGNLTTVSQEYFHVENNPNAKQAFKTLYEISKTNGGED